MSYHFLGIHDCGNLELLYQFLNLKGADLELFKMRYGEKPDPLQVAPGVSVSIADGKANLVEWGSSVYWSPSTHKVMVSVLAGCNQQRCTLLSLKALFVLCF